MSIENVSNHDNVIMSLLQCGHALYRYRNTAWIARRPAFWRYVINAYPPCVKRIRVSRPRGSKDRVGSRGSKPAEARSKSRQQVEAGSKPAEAASQPSAAAGSESRRPAQHPARLASKLKPPRLPIVSSFKLATS
jgi:hypothetical protein